MILGEIGLNETTIYFVIASASSIIFVIQLVLMAVGAGHHGGGFDASHGSDTVAGHDGSTSAFQLFSVQSVLAFLMGFGWTGLGGMNEWKLSRPTTVLLSFAVGTAFLLLSAFLNAQIRRLNNEPKYDVKECIGKTATVYVAIPEKSAGMGQVTVSVSGRKRTLHARSTGTAIAAFATVRVVSVDDDEHLTVEPVQA